MMDLNKRLFTWLPLFLVCLIQTHITRPDLSDNAKVVVGSMLIIGGVSYLGLHVQVLRNQIYNPLSRQINKITKNNPWLAHMAQLILPPAAIYVGYKLITHKK